MSKLVARMAKMKSGNLQGIQRHNQRETDNHSNKDIDMSRSFLNYDLVHSHAIHYQEHIKQIIDSQKISTRAVRKDAVLVDEWIITSDLDFFEAKTDIKEFFQDSVDYFAERCGKQNIAYATVHLDETTPHMHLGIVPMIEGRLSSKQVFDRQALKEIQDELPDYLQEKGHQIERGLKGSEQKHLSVEEFKENRREVERMTEQVAQLTLEASTLSLETNLLNQASYDLWYKDWLSTSKQIPDFKMTYTIKNNLLEHTPLETISVTETTPREYQMSFFDVFDMLKEKFRLMKEYIVEKIENLAFREERHQNKVNESVDRKNALEERIEGLNNELSVKQKENDNLNTVIKEKMTLIDKMERNSELAMALPSYVRPSKLNKDILLVPKEKWLDKHVSANVINDFSNLKQSLTQIDHRIKNNTIYDSSVYGLEQETRRLNKRVSYLQRENTLYWNSFGKLLNNHIISTDLAKQLDLPKSFKREFDLEQSPKLSSKLERKGPTLGL